MRSVSWNASVPGSGAPARARTQARTARSGLAVDGVAVVPGAYSATVRAAEYALSRRVLERGPDVGGSDLRCQDRDNGGVLEAPRAAI